MLLFPAAIVASPPTTVRTEVQATATIRIERPAIANSEEWKRSPKSQRREIIVRDRNGRPTQLRLIEYQ
jgi:hypothetical protein